jgi:predicted dehydrogenase
MSDHAKRTPHATDTSRRGFLAAAAAAAGGAAAAGTAAGLFAAPAWAKGGVGAPLIRTDEPIVKAAPRVPLKEGDPIRMAVIGTGGMGTGHVEGFIRLSKARGANVQVVAVADCNDLHAAGAQKRAEKGQPGVKVEAYRDYKKLLARDDLHGVLIASPEHWHAQMGIDAVLAGKDVYLEKPMTLRLDEGLRLRRVVLANPDIRLQVGTQKTNIPNYLRARDVVQSGKLGVPTFSQTSYCRNSPDGEWNYYGIDPKWKPGDNLDWDAWCGPLGKREWDPKVYARWRRYKDFSTGIVGDLLVHVLTPLLVAIGQQVGWPRRVVAVGSHLVDKAMENHDQVNLLIEFESGHQMAVAGSTCNELGLETIIRCHKANIFLNSRPCVIRPESKFSGEIDDQRIECPDIGDDQDMHRLNWLECIRTRKQPDSDVDQGAKVMVIVDLATRSMWEGGAFTFDSKSMTVARA